MANPSVDAPFGRKWPRQTVPRSRHQIASVVLLLGLCASYALHLAAPFEGWMLEVAKFASLMVTAFAYGYMKRTDFGSLANAERDALDERERSLRDRAGALSHRIIIGMILFLIIALLAIDAALGHGQAMALGSVALLLMHMLFFILGLPGIVLAWIAPDPVPDEETP